MSITSGSGEGDGSRTVGGSFIVACTTPSRRRDRPRARSAAEVERRIMSLPLRRMEITMYRNILVATEGSKLSAKAVAHAIGLAAALGARLTAFYASPD